MKKAPVTTTVLLEKSRAMIESGKAAVRRAGIYRVLFLRRIRGVPDRLFSLSNALGVSTGDEASFLEMGRTLQSIYTNTADLIQFIRETIQSVMGDTDENILGRVGDLARRAETALVHHQERVAGSLVQIREVADHLGGLHQACDQLGRIALNLRVVGLNIGVESTRSAEGKEMFTVVSQEILQLSNTVNAIAARIRGDATAAMTEQITAFDTISGGLQMLKGLTAEAADVVKAAVEETDRCLAAFVMAFETADGRFQEISRRVGEIVMGIQFHDNMRQRVEHITAALEGSARTFRGDAGAAETDSGESATREKALGNACAMVGLQKAQLADVISEINRVHRESADSFEEMGSEIRELAGIMSAVIAEQGPGSDPFSKLSDALAGLGSLLDRGDALGRRIEESVSKATEISRRFSQHLKDVDRISFETKIKALNAIVKAGHMSEEGRTLEVLAQEMNRLSQQTNRFVDHVEEKLTRVGQFGEAAPEDAGEAERVLFDISRMFTQGIEELVQVRSTMNQRAEAASEKADALRATVSRTIGDLGFLTALAEEIAGHLGTLEAISLKLSVVSEKWQGKQAGGMEHLIDTYTMQRERAIHRSTLLAETSSAETSGAESEPETDISIWDDSGDPPPDTGISLWDDFGDPSPETAETAEAEEPPPKKEEDADDFGDNIELF
jgi:methyl-accepting chemotaxis protein